MAELLSLGQLKAMPKGSKVIDRDDVTWERPDGDEWVELNCPFPDDECSHHLPTEEGPWALEARELTESEGK